MLFLDIFRVDANLIESVSQIHLRKETRVLHAVSSGIPTGSWIDIFDGDCVQPTIIHAKTQGLVAFLDKEGTSSKWRLGTLNVACGK